MLKHSGLNHDSQLFTADIPAAVYSRAQVRMLDHLAMTAHDIPGLALMQRAGAAAFAVITARYPACRSLLILCGGGNNAGDGYIVARLGREAGLDVQLIALSPPRSLTGDALKAAELYCQSAEVSMALDRQQLAAAELIVDALLGTGLTRPVTGAYFDAITLINQAAVPVVSLDLPSGLDADSGAVLGTAVAASQTITFVGIKQGLLTASGPDCVGELLFADLQLPDALYQQVAASRYRLQEGIRRQYLAPRERTAHKGRHGHVLVIGGDYGYLGAVCLAATAAARTGAGLITVATRKPHARTLAIHRPELMTVAAEEVAEVQAVAERADVILIGPGLGRSAWAVQLLTLALQATVPLVLDADALNLLAEEASEATRLTGTSSGDRVLTPHPGEAARLLQTDTMTIQQDRFQAIAELQQKYRATIVLKGAGSLVKGDDETIYICTAGNPGMGSGGMGDVLSGMIAALLAQGQSGGEAACLAVYVHAAAGDAAARAGERGLLASDLLPHIRRLVNV